MRRSFRILAAFIVLGALLTAGSSPAQAQGHEVVVDGLDNPRGISVQGKRIFVAEAGRGGDILVDVALGGGQGPVCVGNTGAISEIINGVAVTRAEFPSVVDAVNGACEGPGFGINATGPHGVDVQGKQMHYTLGLGGTPDSRAVLEAAFGEASQFGTVIDQRNKRGFPRDLAAFEAANDPNGEGPDSNPYGVVRGKSATALVVDAGANALLEVRRSSTNVKAVFAPRCVPFLIGPNPIPDQFNPCGDSALFPAQSVPTAVAFHADGDYLVTTLGGFPFPAGESVVYKVDADFDGTATCSSSTLAPAQGCTVFASGLTALVGIDVDQTGKVYVVQLADAGLFALFGGADAGSVQVLDRNDGSVIGSIDGLNAPGGISIFKGEVYITNNSTSPGLGQVVTTGLIH